MASTRSSGSRAREIAVVVLFVVVGVAAVLAARAAARRDVTEVVRDDPLPLGEVPEGEGSVGASDGIDGSGAEEAPGVSDLGMESPFIEEQLRLVAEESDATMRVERMSEGLEESVREVLGRYQSDGRCLLVSAGYLDLLGSVWGCVLQGPGWVDVCVMSEEADGGCTLRSVRLEEGREEMGDVTR